VALKNIGASVRARLLRLAQEKHDSFEGLLVRYVHERLLYRLGSEQGTRFALKGALLFPLWGPDVPRATRDLKRPTSSPYLPRNSCPPAVQSSSRRSSWSILKSRWA